MFYLVCKVCSGVMLSNRISLKIVILAQYTQGKG